MITHGNFITHDLEKGLKTRKYPNYDLMEIPNESSTEVINEDLDKIIEKLNQIDFRFKVTEDEIINAVNKLETEIKEIKNELNKIKKSR